MNQIAINTTQNVKINFNLASIGDRLLAAGIDEVIKIAKTKIEGSLVAFQQLGNV